MEAVVAEIKVLFQNLPGGTEENHEVPQDSRSPGIDLNPGTPEYDAGLLITQPRKRTWSVLRYYHCVQQELLRISDRTAIA
jgi:hypothetical protein